MTAPDNHDPWGSLADSLGVPAGSEPAPPAEKSPAEATNPAAAPAKPVSKPVKADSARREPRPPVSADWNALASDFGLRPEPAAAPTSPPPPPTPQPAATEPAGVTRSPEDESRPRRSPPGDRSGGNREAVQARREREVPDELAKKLASGAPLWDDEPETRAPKPAAATRAPQRAAAEPPVARVAEPVASDEPGVDIDDRAPEAADDDAAGERPRRRRRGRRGGRGRGRSRRDEAGRESDADSPQRPVDDELSDRLDDGEPADDEPHVAPEGAGTGARDDEPRRSRSRRGRGRRSRSGGDDDGERRSPRDQGDADGVEARGPGADDDDDVVDPLTGEPLEAAETDDAGVDENGDPRKKRRRRGRRGGRRRSKSREDGEATTDESDEESHEEATPTGYVAAGAKATKPKSEGSRRRREADGEKAGDDRRRGRRRGRGSEEKAGARSRGRAPFRPVSSSFSQDDEGLEFLGLDETEDGDAPLPARRSDASTDEAVTESGLDAVREVPSWVEAIGIVIAGNLDARSKSPRQDSGRPPRGRNGR